MLWLDSRTAKARVIIDLEYKYFLARRCSDKEPIDINEKPKKFGFFLFLRKW